MTIALTMGLFLNLPFGEVGGAYAQIAVTALPKTVAGGYNISCNNGTDGEVTTVVTGNTGPYTFLWSNSSTGSSINSLSAGTYWVTVTDSLNNTATDTVTLIQPSVLGVSIDAHTFAGGTHISEHGAADGEMYSDVSGGIPPYQYDWNTGSHTEWTYKDRPAGAYTLVVTDAGGCQADADQTLTEPTVFTVDLQLTELQGGTHITCAGGSDGSASATPTGGIPPYTYDWATEDEDSLATDLPAGLQKVKVFDANGVKREVEFTLIAPDTITTTITTSALFPNGYHTSCHDCSNATVTASASGGISPYEYQWLDTDYTSAMIENAGEPYYDLVVRDANGCKAIDKARLSIPERDDWSVNGNNGLNADSTLKWLGTTDSTDLMMKANNQPAMRIGADGYVDVLGQLRLASPTQNSSNAAQLLVVDENGAVAAMEMDAIPAREPGGCFNEPAAINQGYWYSGENRVVVCPNVNVGVGVEFPVQRLQVSGSALFSGNIAIGDITENLALSRLDVRGKTIIGYTEGIGPAYADANLDVRSDGDPARYTFETRDNDGRSSFRIKNNGRVVIGDGPYSEQVGGEAILFLGPESHNIRAVNGYGLVIANQPYWEAIRIPDGTNDVLMPARVSIGAERVVAGPHTNYKLSVDGKIVGKEIYVSNDDNYWADYVFSPGYRLRSLPELKEFIRTNGHLPEVPTAEEVAKEGINIGEMIVMLLKKNEELTLLVIELNEKLDAKCGE